MRSSLASPLMGKSVMSLVDDSEAPSRQGVSQVVQEHWPHRPNLAPWAVPRYVRQGCPNIRTFAVTRHWRIDQLTATETSLFFNP
jgi:hypothetical protein